MRGRGGVVKGIEGRGQHMRHRRRDMKRGEAGSLTSHYIYIYGRIGLGEFNTRCHAGVEREP